MLKITNMQYMTEQIYDIHSVVENCTDSKLIDRTHDYNKCYKQSHSNQNTHHGLCFEDDYLFNLFGLKPCRVVLRRLNLMGHNGSVFSNCCYNSPEVTFNGELVTSKINYNPEKDNLVVQNKSENSSKKRNDSNCEDLKLFVETLCEDFYAIGCEQQEKTKNVDNDGSPSYSAKERIKDAPIELLGNMHKEKQFAKTCESSKPIISSSLECKTSNFPILKRTVKKIEAKQNFKNVAASRRYLYAEKGSQIENEVPFNSNIKFQTKYLSFKERYTNSKAKVLESPKNDYNLFVNKQNSHDVPFVISSVRISSKVPATSKVDKALQAGVLIFSSNSSSQNSTLSVKLKGTEWSKNYIDDTGIEVLEHPETKFKGTTKSYSVGIELINKSSACLPDHKIKSVQKSDSILLKCNDCKPEVLRECVTRRNLNETIKYGIPKNEEQVKNNVHIRVTEYLLKDAIRNKQSMKPINFVCNTDVTDNRDGVSNGQSSFVPLINLIKPCYVLVKKLPITSFYNEKGFSANVSDKPKISTHSEKNSYSPSKNSIFSTENSEISAVLKFTSTNKKTTKVPRKTTEIKRCSVSIEKLSDDEYMKYVSPLKSSIKCQGNIAKLKRKFFTMLQFRRKLWCQRSKNISKHISILKERQIRNLFKDYKNKKWRKKAKEIPKECENYRQVNADVNRCKNVNVSSTPLKENQCINNASANLLPQYCLNGLNTLHCHVLLEKINVKYLNANKNLYVSQHDFSSSKSSNIVPNCLMGNFRIKKCSVLLKKLNVKEYLVQNKNLHLESENQQNQDKNLSSSKYGIKDKYNRCTTSKNFVQNSFFNKLKRGRPCKTKRSDIKKIKIKDYCDLEETLESDTVINHSNMPCDFETVVGNNDLICDSDIIVNYSNFICDSHYKCVQCRKSITNDIELYNHFCCGKREKGYICDICERIFETVPDLKNHIIEIHSININGTFTIQKIDIF